MRRFLISLLVVITLGLCAICTVQWTREARLRRLLSELGSQLEAEAKLRLEAEEKAARFEEEIGRLTALRAEVEAKLLAAVAENKVLVEDQSARGYSIAVLMNEARRIGAEMDAVEQLAGKGTEAISERNAEVTAQNTAIEKANEQLKKLAAERDAAIAQLNSRTEAFNELVEKYNKLAKGR